MIADLINRMAAQVHIVPVTQKIAQGFAHKMYGDRRRMTYGDVDREVQDGVKL